MKLWIRSQDKLALSKIEQIAIEQDKKIIGYNGYCVKLGEYKSKERALEVLDEIEKLLMPTYLISNITKEEGMKLQDNLSFGTNMIQTNDSSSIEQINGTLVFQMPEE